MAHRLLETSDCQAVESLWDYCFEKRETGFFKWFFSESFRYDRTMGSFSGEALKAMLNLAPYTLSLKEAEIPVSYIVGVATWPEYRGKGEVKELLYSSFERMREWGEYLAILMPSRPEFYYPLDFQIYNYHLRYRIPIEELKKITGKECTFIEITEEDIPMLSDLYEKSSNIYQGRTLRDDKKWQSWIRGNISEGGKAYLIYHGGKPEGYLFYSLDSQTFKVSDWTAISPNAYKSLMEFCYQHRAQAQYAEWDAPQDDVFQFLLPETKERLFSVPFMTSRIVDVEKLVKSLNWQGTGRVVVEIEDSLLEWNNSIYIWELNDRECSFERYDGAPDLKITIGGLAQWIFGQMDSRTLEQAGFLSIYSKDKAYLMDKWMPRSLTYVNEYF